MPRYAHIQDGTVREVREFDSIEGRFHPSLVWVEAATDVEQGWLYDAETETFSEPEPGPVVPSPPDKGGFLEALIAYFGVDRAENLMADHPVMVRALDGGNWTLAQNRMQKMLDDGDVTQAEYDDVQAMWDTHNLSRPEGS